MSDVRDWLRAALANGPRFAATVKFSAARAGYSVRAVERAASALGVTTTRTDVDGQPAYKWSLPNDNEIGDDS